MLKDKENEIGRKEEQIKAVKKEAAMHKKQDLDEIQRLTDIVHKRQQDVISQKLIMNQIELPNRKMEQADTAIQEKFRKHLTDKDSRIKELEQQVEAEKKSRAKMKDEMVKLMESIQQLQDELELERKKNEAEKLRKQNETLQKLVK